MNRVATTLVILFASTGFAQTTHPAEEQNHRGEPVRLSSPPKPGGSLDRGFLGSHDLERFRLVAVQHRGRLKTFDTLAR